jgi:hypothetical protein
MKKNFLFAILSVSVIAGDLNAQTHTKERDPAKQEQRMQERASERTGQLVRALGLNDEQALKVAAINSEFAKGMAALRAEGVDEAARREGSKALRQQRATELKAVLTEEQVIRMKELEEARRKAKLDKGGSARGEGMLRGGDGGLMEQLGLSDEQWSGVKETNATYAKGMAELRAASLDGSAHKAKARALREKRDGDLRNVLTEDQYRKLQALRKERREAKAGARGMDVK